MIRRLEDLTGLDATKIRLDDKDVMELFHSTKSLGITPEDINGIPLGSLGVPEFGTDFAMQTVYIIYGKIRKNYLLIAAAAYCAVGEDRVN